MEPVRRLKTFVPTVIDKGAGIYIIKNPVMTTGWASNYATSLPHEEWFVVDLGAVYEINEVRIMPAGGTRGGKCYAFPKSFVLYVSEDGEYWTEVVRKENYPIPSAEMQVFDFATVNARYVRFVGTELRTKPTDANKFRMQIAEIEVYNTEN